MGSDHTSLKLTASLALLYGLPNCRDMWKLLLNYAKRHLWKVICEAWKKNKGEGWWGEYSLMHNSSPLSPPSLPITPPFTPLSSSFPTSPPTAQESLEKRTIRNVTTYLEAIWKCPHNRVNIWAAWNICLIDLWIVKDKNIAIFISLTSLMSRTQFLLYILTHQYWCLHWQMCSILKFYSALVMTRVTDFQWSLFSSVTKDIFQYLDNKLLLP